MSRGIVAASIVLAGLTGLGACSGESDEGAADGQQGDRGAGGARGTGGAKASSGGVPSNGLGGNGQPCGGARGYACDFAPANLHPPAKRPSLSVEIGDATGEIPPYRARVCRNATCATVNLTRLAIRGTRGAVRVSDIQFGTAGTEQVRIAVDEYLTRRVRATWYWPPETTAVKNGDVYSLRVLDESGAEVAVLREEATYVPYTLHQECGPTVECFDTNLSTSPPGQSFPEGGLRDGGPEVDAADGGGPEGGGADGGRPEGGEPDAGGDAAAPKAGCCAPTPGPIGTLPTSQCLALGGADLGGCFKTCGLGCGTDFQEVIDERGCPAWTVDTTTCTPLQ